MISINKIGILGKLLLFLSITLLSCFLLILILFNQIFQDYSNTLLNTFDSLVIEKYKHSLKGNTEIAVSILTTINNLDNLTPIEKKEYSKIIIRNLRFGDDGYFFVYQNGTGVNLIHGSDNKLEGKNLWNLTGPNNKDLIIQQLDKVANEKKVFYEYDWSKPGSNLIVPKLGTAILVPETDMWVGTGSYIEEIENNKQVLDKHLSALTKSIKYQFLIGFLLVTAIALAVVFLLGRSLIRPIRQLILSSKSISEGNYNIIIESKSSDEIGQLSFTFNKMATSIKDFTENMENKVEERTRKLQTTLNQLNESNCILEGLSEKLSRYLSPQIREMIFSGRQDVIIQSHRKKLTVFFSDIKNFTQTTERLETEALTDLLNNYLDEMSRIAIKHGATIDKFIGDAILVFFGDPESRGAKEDALAAISMALEMQSRMIELQEKWFKLGISEPFHVRMGINTGYCTVGNFGSNDRMDYTIIGSQVNLASRLECAACQDQILISHETYALICDKFHCIEMETINVKGISYPVKTYIVKDKTDKLVCEGKLVKDQLDGFSYSLDLSSITENSAEQIKEVLEIINSKILNKKIIKRHKTEITTDENINDIFYKLTQEINNDFNTKDVVLTTNILITQTTLHPDKLKIIIRDFLINTFSLSSDGNHVNVTIEREINVIKITVDDNNTIIPKEIVPKIFMQDIKTITDYSGVSLYSAKILVKELKGKITVQNKKPAGNRFIVHIPE